MATDIQAAEHPIKDIFCKKYVFSIPPYQRPYAWEEEQAQALLGDFLGYLEKDTGSVDDINPYFLGSIVLIKTKDAAEADVVDGQQRLTTLTILLSVLRELVPEEYGEAFTSYLYDKANPLEGNENSYRLTLRDRDAQFFREYVQDKGGLQKLLELSDAALSDSQKNIRDNAKSLYTSIEAMPGQERVRLAQFIICRCFLVIVATPDFDSAYRIFSVLNDRGMDLTATDILKSEIIGNIPETKQENYTEIWEDMEELLGRDSFSDLFSHIRMIYRRAKPQGSVLKEFRAHVKPNPLEEPINFLEHVLRPNTNAYAEIQRCGYQSMQYADEINTYFQYLGRIDNADWIPPAIHYLSKYHSQPEQLRKFFKELDRLASVLMICRANINERIKRYSELLNYIDGDKDLYAPESPINVTPKECREAIQRLDGPLYLERKIRLYVLLRLDQALSTGEAVYAFKRITVEHVLPQHPSEGSQWLQWFPHEELREHYVHRLGNLALLSGYKNSKAQNFDFKTKKDTYFTDEEGSTPFPLTSQVLKKNEWTPEVIEQRQELLMSRLKQLWRLEEPASVAEPATVA